MRRSKKTAISLDSVGERAGWPNSIIAGWKRRGICQLLSAQAEAWEAWKQGGNLVLSAPTGSGKTMVAEMAVAHELALGRKGVLLVPTRALAEEKFAEWKRWLEGTGYRVVCATRERPEFDPRIASGEFDALIAVYEKFNHHLLARGELLSQVGVVVADEIQTLGDPVRGGTLDLLLTRILHSPYAVRLMALSAVLSEPTLDTLAKWLNAEVVRDSRRPSELREGVLELAEGRFRFRTEKGGEIEEESLGTPKEFESLTRRISQLAAERSGPADLASVAALAVTSSLIERGEPVLLFAPTRDSARVWAGILAELGGELSPSQRVIEQMDKVEPCRAARELMECLAGGVAFHHADLHDAHRAILESGFRAGEIRAMVATPTLAMGVNLSCANVVQYPWRIQSGYGGRASRIPLGRSRFANQGGRAGRLGGDAKFGRSIVAATTSAEADRLWNELILASPEPIPTPLLTTDASLITLDGLAETSGRTLENLRASLAETFSGQSDPGWSANFGATLPSVLERCAGEGWITRDEQSGFWRLAEPGGAILRTGLSPATASGIKAKWLTNRESDLNESYALQLLAETFEGKCAAQRPRRLCGSAAVAALLADAMEGLDAEEMESKYRVEWGAVARMKGDFRWLARAVASLTVALGCSPEYARIMGHIAERLSDADSLVDDARLTRIGDRRSPPTLDKALPTTPSPSPSPSPSDFRSEMIEINLLSPGIIRIGHREIALPPLSFELLAALAERPGEVVTRQALYARLWPDGGPEEQQLDGHRRTMLRRLQPALGERAVNVAEVVRGIGLRLNLPAESVLLRR